MKRRDFLTATGLAAAGTLGRIGRAESKTRQSQREYYELRAYRLKSADRQKLVLGYLKAAAVPALNRIGIEPVGVFTVLEPDSPDLYVLLVHRSLESVVAASRLIAFDPDYRKAAAGVLDAPKSDPAYERIESSLMLAFEAIPRLEIPTKAESRIFQLRIYESHNSLAAKKKVEMFNTGGEIAIFRKAAMNPVFFGESLIGPKLPNLTYMLGFDDMAAKEKAWNKFRQDPDWNKLKEDPYYKDTVSNVTNILLRPASCSQI
ncbi:MAG TPA: NIPSNAP family protein [Sedimentisphaerales bacterium]|nr:NIPSNAP family protein [Sedimentisphaerales bacterium]